MPSRPASVQAHHALDPIAHEWDQALPCGGCRSRSCLSTGVQTNWGRRWPATLGGWAAGVQSQSAAVRRPWHDQHPQASRSSSLGRPASLRRIMVGMLGPYTSASSSPTLSPRCSASATARLTGGAGVAMGRRPVRAAGCNSGSSGSGSGGGSGSGFPFHQRGPGRRLPRPLALPHRRRCSCPRLPCPMPRQ